MSLCEYKFCKTPTFCKAREGGDYEKKKQRTISNGKIIYDFLSGAGICAWNMGVTKSSSLEFGV